jgi:hypothetical protein
MQINGITDQIKKITNDKHLKTTLLNRWVDGVKSPNITAICKKYPVEAEIIRFMDTMIDQLKYELMFRVEEIFLYLGGLVTSKLTTSMHSDPENAARKVAEQFMNSMHNMIGDIRFMPQVTRFECAGGMDHVSGDEGITFFVDNHFVKMTGTFGPINQLVWMAKEKC